jgi:hypothetical protein
MAVLGARGRWQDVGRAWIVLVLLALAVALAGCAGSSQPFSKSQAPTGKTPPPISITAMTGLPADKAEILFQSLAASAGKRDIAIVKGQFEGNFLMAGEFQALPGAAGVTVAYRWSVTDAKGQVIHTIEGSEPGRPAAGDPWEGVDPDLLRRIAAFTAENLSSRLAQLGYATQAAGLPPPVGMLAEAGPDAEKDIDLETLYGPLTASLAPVADLPQPAADEVTKAPAVAAAEKPDPNRLEIRAVAVTRVTGAPGKGNRELLAAMRRTLGAAGWPVLEAPREDAITIRGEVALAPAVTRSQKVVLKWVIAMPDGRVLGTVDQANEVPAGSLDQGWGKTAELVAGAAAEGIFEVVRKAQTL